MSVFCHAPSAIPSDKAVMKCVEAFPTPKVSRVAWPQDVAPPAVRLAPFVAGTNEAAARANPEINQKSRALWIRIHTGYGIVSKQLDCVVCMAVRFVADAAHSERLVEVGILSATTEKTLAGIIAAPVRSHLEVVSDTELRGYGDFARVDNDMTEPHWLPSTPYRSNTWARVASYRPPRLGEDTIDLLNELGFGEEETAELQSRNVIYSSTEKCS